MDYCNALKKNVHWIELPGYVISLDNIDLNLLPLKYGDKDKRDEPVPLWSVAGPSKEYFEFEVLSEEINDDGEGERLENASTIRCHICDVAVPVNYFEDHKKSLKHQVCMTITDISLERARHQMALSIDSGASRRSETTYYCAPCSVAVSIANEGTHENTEQHRLSVAHEKFSNYLMLIYKDKNNFQKVYGDIEKELEKPASGNWCEDDCKTIIVKNETEESVNVNLIEAVKKPARVNLQKYIENLNHSLIDCSIEYLDDYTITLRTKSGAELRVPFDNFHGIQESDKVVKCRVCRKLVDDKYDHIVDENHMLKIRRTIYNKHCIRPLDLVLNHCILCNEIIHSAEAHILYSGSHKTSLKDALIDDYAEVREILAKNYIDQATNNDRYYYCNLCQMYFDKSQLDEHINTDKHSAHNNPESEELFKYCSLCDLKLGSGKKALTRHERKDEHRYKVWLAERDVTKHHHMEKSLRNTIICKICEVRINNSSDRINDHINSSNHKSKYNMLLATHSMERLDNISVRCNVCNKSLLFLDELTHMTIRKHKNKLIKNENKMMNSAYTTKTIQTSKFTKEEILYDKNKIEKSAGTLYCDVCSMAVEAKLFDIHFASNIHKTNLAKQFNPETTRPSSSIYTQPKTLPKKLHYLFDPNDDVKTVKCKVCNVNVTFDNDNILTHRKDRTHKDKYAALLQSNTMFRIKNRCFCECCMEIMKIIEEHKHIMSSKHFQNKYSMTDRMDTATLKGIAYKMFNKDIADEKREKRSQLWGHNTKTGFISRPSIETQTFSDIEDEDDDSQYQEYQTYIFMTNSTVTQPENERDVENDKKESLESNSEGSYVSLKSNSTPEDNQSFKTASDFKLDIETQKVTEENDLHLEPYDHLFKKTDNDKEVNCEICLCAVPSKYALKREHLEGAKHISKYEVLLQLNNVKEKMHESKVTLEFYHCNACGIDFVKTDLLAHVDSASHKLYLTAQPSTSKYCTLKEISNFEHIPSKTIKQNALELALYDSKQANAIISQTAHLLKRIDKNVMYCELCDSEIYDTIEQLVYHICCPYHKAKVQSLLNEHEVREIDDAYFCELCSEFTKGNEIEHIYSEKHKKKFHDCLYSTLPPKEKLKSDKGKRDKGYTCTVCNIEILNSPNIIRLHNEGQRHKQNLLNCEQLRHDGPWMEALKYSNNKNTQDFVEECLQIPITIELPKCEPKSPTVTINHAIVNTPNTISNIDKLKKVSNEINKEKFQHETHMKLFCSEQTKSTNFNKNPTKTVPDKAVTTKPVTIATDDHGLFCTVCKDIVSNNTRSINDHLKGVTHKTNEANQIPPQTKSLCSDQTKTTETTAVKAVTSKSVITTDVNGAFCTIQCKVKVPNNAGNINDHLKGFTHKTNEANQISSQKKSLCSNQTKTTETAAVKAVTSKSVITTDVNGAFCTVCKVKVPNNAGNINDHLKGFTHKTNEANQISSQKKSLCSNQTKTTETAAVKAVTSKSVITIDVNGAFCTVCKVKVPNNAGNINDHLKGFTHKTNEANQISSQKKSLCSDQTKTTETAAVQAVTSTSVTITTDVNEAFCTVCRVEVPNNVRNIDEHLKGEAHRKENVKLKGKPVIISTDNHQVFCTVCKALIPNSKYNIQDHLNGTRHSLKLALNSAATQSTHSVDRYSTRSNTSNNHAVGKNAEINMKRVRQTTKNVQMITSASTSTDTTTSNSRESSTNRYKSTLTQTIFSDNICHICNVAVFNHPGNIKDHIEGARHKNNIAMLEENLTADKKELPAKTEEKTMNITNESKNLNIKKQSEISNTANPLLDCITKLSEKNTSRNQNKAEYPVSTDTLKMNTNTSTGKEATTSCTNNFANTENDTDTHGDAVVTNNGVITNHDLNANHDINTNNDGNASNDANSRNDANTNNDAVTNNATENRQAEDASETSDSEGFFICNICEMLIINNQTDIQCHLNSFHHKNKEIEKNEKAREAKINLDNLTHFCDICNVEIAKNSMGAVKEHNESLQHLRNFEKLLKANKILIRNDKVCHCKICDLYFSKFSLSSHIIRETHKNLLKAGKAATDSPS